MDQPPDCQKKWHDFRRVYPSDLRGDVRRSAEEQVLAVVCCNCGLSPLADGFMGALVKGDWPMDRRITAFYDDPEKGPSVEFTVERTT